MANRTDLAIRFDLEPRVMRIAAPSAELVVQDLHDTARDIEDEPANLIYPTVISTAGKEDLGGGVSVGLTSTLQNMILAFDPRTVSVSQGTATAVDADGSILTDSGATFIADGVLPGAVVVNFTDQSVGSVARVTSETQLLLFPIVRGAPASLGDGSTNAWAVSDVYKVWNIEQVLLSGGNIVAVDGVGADISAILPTFGTQVIQSNSSSATTTSQTQLEHSTFNAGVTVDVVDGLPGTSYPLGTPGSPVGNLSDGLAIANARSLRRFYIVGDITVDSGLVYDNFVFVGDSPTSSVITISAAASVIGCEFINAEIGSGSRLDGSSTLINCIVSNLDYVDGIVTACTLIPGVIVLSGAGTALFFNCRSGAPGVSLPTIDLGGAGSALAVQNYTGQLALRNKTGPEEVEVTIDPGELTIEATCDSTGMITVKGVGGLIDNSGVTQVVDDTDLVQGSTLALLETRLREMYEIHGLDATKPMTVTPSTRAAGTISQTISTIGNDVTVTRDP